ncbi:thymidine phosphorylase family protein [Hymenobacter sp. DG25B]|uniref:thymidine phosphorylase family protein n=1 Tax=Hymenobacter sp. DG25B TaxID=1385664 RepID=UPI0005C8959E|nr:thymidine phosphorylase family protein [Hymenobacter sp. DG25B]
MNSPDLLPPPPVVQPAPGQLRLRRMGIDTRNEHVVFLRSDSPVCHAEGFRALSRLKVTANGHTVIASLNTIVGNSLLEPHEVGVSEVVWEHLRARPGEEVHLMHLPPLESMHLVRAKMYGRRLLPEDYRAIMLDVAAERYSNVELAAFVTACVRDVTLEETISLTQAMIAAGRQLHWPAHVVADKHSIGGLPGNRTTPVVVAIVAAAGLLMPKTSSRAITSPAGTADTVEVLTSVNLTLRQMRRVVAQHGACLAWGGAMQLSPADDILIRVERALDIDSPAQMVASVLSKKVAAGATHVVIDVPVGPTAKVRSLEEAQEMVALFRQVGQAVGLKVEVMLTDGSQPVGRGIGPALEARDVLAVLQNSADAPPDLREKSLHLAATLLELTEHAATGTGAAEAAMLLSSGKAWQKFQDICQAQGGLHFPRPAALHWDMVASRPGLVLNIDNRRLATLAKLAGAPWKASAGIDLHVRLRQPVQAGQPLFTLYAESPGELTYARDYLHDSPEPIIAY